jgi:uncharacterized glyoxalase superfamily protein PhnB
MAQPIPQGFHSITPFISVNNAEKVVEFLHKLGAEEKYAFRGPDGELWHCQMQFGDSMIMIGDPMDKHPSMPSMLYIYVPDADALYKKAVQAGGVSVQEPTDQFYGDRSGGVTDPCGNVWWFATHKEDVSDEEMKRRAEKMAKAA